MVTSTSSIWTVHLITHYLHIGQAHEQSIVRKQFAVSLMTHESEQVHLRVVFDCTLFTMHAIELCEAQWFVHNVKIVDGFSQSVCKITACDSHGAFYTNPSTHYAWRQHIK